MIEQDFTAVFQIRIRSYGDPDVDGPKLRRAVLRALYTRISPAAEVWDPEAAEWVRDTEWRRAH